MTAHPAAPRVAPVAEEVRAMTDYERAAFLRNQPVWFATHTWLKQIDLAGLIELWWLAQNEKADEEDKRQARLQNPDDFYGKSNAYITEWFAKRRADGCRDE